jgi:hypothetical protein
MFRFIFEWRHIVEEHSAVSQRAVYVEQRGAKASGLRPGMLISSGTARGYSLNLAPKRRPGRPGHYWGVVRIRLRCGPGRSRESTPSPSEAKAAEGGRRNGEMSRLLFSDLGFGGPNLPASMGSAS